MIACDVSPVAISFDHFSFFLTCITLSCTAPASGGFDSGRHLVDRLVPRSRAHTGGEGQGWRSRSETCRTGSRRCWVACHSPQVSGSFAFMCWEMKLGNKFTTTKVAAMGTMGTMGTGYRFQLAGFSVLQDGLRNATLVHSNSIGSRRRLTGRS